MSNQSGYLKTISHAPDAVANAIFVHGLSGDASETWQCGKSDELWPSWLNELFPRLGVYSLGYPASKFAKNEQDLFERAGSVLDYLTSKGFGDRPLIFVTHSLGGLLTKSVLRKARDSSDAGHKAIADSTKLVIFIATPHEGASLATLGKKVLPRLISSKIELLANSMGVLNDLKQAYRDLCDANTELKTVTYYETMPVFGHLVVSRSSSDPGVGNCVPIGVDKDHVTICKPDDRDDQVYLGVSRHVRQVVEQAEAKFAAQTQSFETPDFSVASETDRRSLLDKMIDANREDEYSIANDYQNQFAQSFYRQGLSGSARRDHDLLLSDVEQRFITNIYLKHICKGSSDDQAQAALQSDVIDPICAKYAEDSSVTGITILQALYFLTEQCRIRWDAE